MMLVVNADQFYTQCWLFLIDFLQTSQVPGVEVFLCAKSGSIRRFPDCTRITFLFRKLHCVFEDTTCTAVDNDFQTDSQKNLNSYLM